jgi:hypothetical protein
MNAIKPNKGPALLIYPSPEQIQHSPAKKYTEVIASGSDNLRKKKDGF